jgi:hypothetical protein
MPTPTAAPGTGESPATPPPGGSPPASGLSGGTSAAPPMIPTPSGPVTPPPLTSSPPPQPSRSGLRMPTMGPRPVRKAARRTRVVLRSVSPLSVFKLSLVFYFCVMLIVYLALLIVYVILSAAGAIDAFGRVLGNLFAKGNSTLGPTPVHIDGRLVFTYLFVAGCVFTVVWSLVTMFMAFLYNLTSDIVGGVEITLAQKPPRSDR